MAMTGIIKVLPEELKSTAAEFSNEASQLSNLTNNMMEIVTSLASVWEGDASQTYRSHFSQLQDDMTRMFNMITEHSNDLQLMASQYITVETENMELASTLEGDVIS